MNNGFIKQNIQEVRKGASINTKATFNQLITPSVEKYKSRERDLILQENLTPKQLSKILPKVELPKIDTLIKTKYKKLNVEDTINVVKIVSLETDKTYNFKINTESQKVIFNNGKEYDIQSLTSFSSRTGKSLDKDEAMELANKYLNLGIPSKSKKSVFIKAIREKLGLEPE